MADPLSCPRCSGILTDTEVVTLHRQYANSLRKTKSGGKNGGRPASQAGAVPICVSHWRDVEEPKGNPAVHELTYSPLEDL